MNDMMQYWQQEWDAHRQDFNKWQEYLFQTSNLKPESISSIAEDTDRITGNGILIGAENLSSIYHPNEKRNVPGTVGGYLDMLYSTKAGKYIIKKLVENKEFVCYISENTTNNPNPHYDRQTHKISFFKRNKYGQIANSVIDNQKQSMVGISITLAHELFHAFQDYEQIDYHHSGACEVEAYLFSCIYYCQLCRNKNGVHWVFSLNSNNIPPSTKMVFTPI